MDVQLFTLVSWGLSIGLVFLCLDILSLLCQASFLSIILLVPGQVCSLVTGRRVWSKRFEEDNTAGEEEPGEVCHKVGYDGVEMCRAKLCDLNSGSLDAAQMGWEQGQSSCS